MKNTNIIVLFACLISLCSCNNQQKTENVMSDPYPVKYENELFSVEMPDGWEVDASGWKGLDSLKNVVDIYSQNAPVWLHFVKTFLNIQWEDIDKVTEMALNARYLCGDDVSLIQRIDSVEVGGYPSSILCYATFVDNDTIIQKQYVTYLQDSHIIMYFNENFHFKDCEEAEKIGDEIIANIKLKKVKNPLDDVEHMIDMVQKAIDNNEIDEEMTKRVKKVLEDNNYQYSRE